MSEAQNTQIVKDAYAAFKQGDIPSVIGLLDENVDWHGVIGTEGVLPQAGRRRGRAAVTKFFSEVNATYAFEVFDPQEFVAQGDEVIAMGHYRAKMKPTGQMVDSDWAMAFTIRNGKIVRFREFTDSAQMVKAYAGQPTSVSA